MKGFIHEQWGWGSARTVLGVRKTRCLLLGSCNFDSLSGIVPVFHTWLMHINLMGWWFLGKGHIFCILDFEIQNLCLTLFIRAPCKYPEILVSFVGQIRHLIWKTWSHRQSLHLCCLVDRKIGNGVKNQTKLQKVMSELPPFVRQNNFTGEIFPFASCHARPIPHLETSYVLFIK